MGERPWTSNPKLQEPHTYFVILVLLSFLLLLPSLLQKGLSGYDDALYAHEGKEIALHGGWGTIRFDGHPNFEYPPLFIWLEALSIKGLGASDFAAKLPSGLLGFGTLFLVYFLAKSISDDQWVAVYSLMALMSTQYFMNGSTHAMTDVPFTCFFTCAILLYVKGLRDPKYLALAGLPISLALLTRSVIGLIPLGLILAHLLVIKRYDLLWSRHMLTALALTLFLPSIWFAYEFALHGNDFITGHFGFVAKKISSSEVSAGWHPSANLFFYVTFLLERYWPWLPLLAAGLIAELKQMVRRRDEAASLLILWIAFVIVPFSFVESKYGRYVMPMFPACALVVGRTLERWIPPLRRVVFVQVLCWLGFATVIGLILFPAKPRATDMRALAPVAEAHTVPGEHVVLYTYGQTAWDYQNQFLWYGNRYSDLLTNYNDVLARLGTAPHLVAIMDKQSFRKVADDAAPVQLLRESDRFVCFQSVSSGPSQP